MTSAHQTGQPKSRADILRFLQGADSTLVSEILEDMPPSFFIVGAPRCGTTALSRALAGNPHISFPKPKETHFLLEDRSTEPIEEVRRLYLERFHPNLKRDSQAIGDGSVSYLYDPNSLRRALSFDSRAKFIVSVRNPVDMLRSFHARLVFLLDEDEEDFSRAWELQEDRRAGRNIPKRCRDPQILQYADVARLGKQVEQLFEVVGRERCYVSVFDDFIQNPGEVYQRLLKFIGVDDDGRREFQAKRGNMGFKWRWLQQFAVNPPAWIYRLINFSDAGTIKILRSFRRRVKRFNKVPKRHELPKDMQATLREYYSSDVEKLSELLGRDLTHWVKA